MHKSISKGQSSLTACLHRLSRFLWQVLSSWTKQSSLELYSIVKRSWLHPPHPATIYSYLIDFASGNTFRNLLQSTYFGVVYTPVCYNDNRNYSTLLLISIRRRIGCSTVIKQTQLKETLISLFFLTLTLLITSCMDLWPLVWSSYIICQTVALMTAVLVAKDFLGNFLEAITIRTNSELCFPSFTLQDFVQDVAFCCCCKTS